MTEEKFIEVPRFYSINEVAKYLKRREEYVLSLINKGKLSSSTIEGKTLIANADFMKYLSGYAKRFCLINITVIILFAILIIKFRLLAFEHVELGLFVFIQYFFLAILLILGTSYFTIFRDNFQFSQIRWPIYFMTIIYGYFFCFALILALIIFPGGEIGGQGNDAAYYFFGALIQSQAAIIAIIISLSLVAVELTSQKYSQRFGDYFKYSFDWVIILGIYLLTIVVSMGVLRSLTPNGLDWNIGFFPVLLIVFSLVLIFPYTWNTMTKLRPDFIVSYIRFKIPTLPEEEISHSFLKLDFYCQLFFDIVQGSTKKDQVDQVTFDKSVVYLEQLLLDLKEMGRFGQIKKVLTYLDSTISTVDNFYMRTKLVRIRLFFGPN